MDIRQSFLKYLEEQDEVVSVVGKFAFIRVIAEFSDNKKVSTYFIHYRT